MDTRAQSSVLLGTEGPMSNKKLWVQRATGVKQYSWTIQRSVDLRVGRVSHSFLVVPACPILLLGRELLTKIGAQIHFWRTMSGRTNWRTYTGLNNGLGDEYQLFEPEKEALSKVDYWLQTLKT